MVDLINIHDMLLDTQSAIEQTKRAIAENPELPSLSITMRSLMNRQRILESQFLEATNRLSLDVCSYRMFPDDTRVADPSILAISSILSSFQSLFTLAYDAVKHGPKQRGTVAKEIEEVTTFNFGYAFSGSTGIVLTVPRDRQKQLFGDTNSDEAVSSIFEMMKAESPADIRKTSQRFGSAVVRALLKFAKAHLDFHVGAEVEWRRGEVSLSSGFFQSPQFHRVEEAILETSAEVKETVEVTGLLEGANVRNRTFDIKTDDGEIIKGHFKDAIDESHEVRLPQRYRATITRTTTIQFSTEEEQVENFLNALEGPLRGFNIPN